MGMRKILPIILLLLIVASIIAGYVRRCGDNSDQNMYRIANRMYQKYILEYGVDSTLFMPVVINDRDSSTKVYRWAALAPTGDTAGVEVTVARSRKIEPELREFGRAKALISLLNTKYMKMDDPNK